ncbi:MAG TPA: M48 family metalloprotease [Pyrinomonadaceae bacterium]|nr:M48 family metalloprotease [Pyrinomonadaceae bacterium]
MLKTTCCRFLLLFACLLLIVTPVQAQDDEEEYEIPQNQAYLGVYTDPNGAANVSVIIPAEVQDQEQLKRIIAGSFSFPIQFDIGPTTRRYSFDEAADQAAAESKSERIWTTISGKSPRAFTGGMLSSTCQIDLRSLLPLLRQYNVEYLKVLVLFQNGSRNVKIHGANRIPNVPGVNLYNYDLLLDVHTGVPPVLNFSMGYSAGDLLKNSSPLLLFLLLPALATLISARRSSANPEELWGKHLRFVHRLLNVVWVVWLPVYFVSSVGEIIMFVFGGDLLSLGSVGQLVNVAFYFIPPVIAMFLCHVASGRVYEQLRPVDWSPRQVVRHAVIASAISLIPMFLVIVGLSMFVRSPRQAVLFVIVGYVGYILLSQNMGKLLGSRLHALTSGDLRDRIFDLAHRAGVKLQQVYVLPETSAQLSNAFARSDNSVMITNSLIKNLSRREVDGIMAHEIGHLQARHPQTAGTVMTVAIVIANLVATFIYKITYLTNAFPIILGGAIGVAYLVTFFRSRRNERQADAIGISLTGDPEAFISGLAKLSRLNLMPLHSGGWGESLDTHPGAMSRFQEIAKAHGISASRLQELVTNAETPENKYLPIADEVDTTVFSTEFKNKYRMRWAFTALFVLLISPAPFAWALARDGVSFFGMLALALEGIVWSFGISLLLRNRIVYWGYQSGCRRLKMKLDKRGLSEAARHGNLVGLAPAAESRKYEGYSFWDMGVLWLTKEKLYYIGEQCEFALEREQVHEVYSCDTAPDWVTEKSLYIRWRDFPEGPTQTLHFVATGEVAVTKARRAIDELQTRLQAWMQQSEDFPVAGLGLESVGLPVFPEITSTLAPVKFNPAYVLKAAFNLAIFAAVLAFAIRLSYTSIVYMALALFILTFVDELSKVIKGREVTQISGTYQPGSWKNA